MIKYIIIITIVVLGISCVLFIIIRNAVRNKKIRNLQKNYPNAFRCWRGPNWKKKKHELLLHTASEWKSKESQESQELNRIRI